MISRNVVAAERPAAPGYLALADVRAAFNAIAMLDPAARARGVCTASSGHHAQAVAPACALHGVSATILMPSGAPALAAVLSRQVRVEGLRVGVVLSGGNADPAVFTRALA